MNLPSQNTARFVIWPYIGTGTVALIANLLPEDAAKHMIVLLGIVLICPFMPVQYAILNKKIDRTEGIVWGFIGPLVFFLLSTLVIGSALALIKSK